MSGQKIIDGLNDAIAGRFGRVTTIQVGGGQQSGMNIYGLREARKIVRATKALVKSSQSEYAKGYRAGLKQADEMISIHINAILARVHPGE